ncbi:response regulator transcription factor [Streptomyces sp. NPDC047928]|uniref:response regulator transcription factor n=1 Tax=Streptomyces sp. NPDC047928 TaxID=3365492 RepID=UPI003714D2D4
MIIDDDESARTALAVLLDGAPGTEVRAVLGGTEAPATIVGVDADLALIGRVAEGPGQAEVIFAAALARREPLALAGYGGFDTTGPGAKYLNGVLPPSLTGKDFVHAVHVLAGGLRVWATRPDQAARLAHLTPREREVLTLLSDGLSNDGIAHRLALHVGTVKDHIRAVYTKCGVANRVEAALFAHGLTAPRPGLRRPPAPASHTPVSPAPASRTPVSPAPRGGAPVSPAPARGGAPRAAAPVFRPAAPTRRSA